MLAELGCDLALGLDSAEAAQRLAHHGPNEIREQRRAGWSELLARQFSDLFIAILAVAALVSFLAGEPIDAGAIAAILVLNGVLGFAPEWRAERAIEALRRLLTPRYRIVREGKEQTLETPRVVPGEVVLLETGDRVPADLRLVAVRELRIDESALTGEPSAVEKGMEAVAAGTPLSERTSLAWMGTSVLGGRARGVVIATAMATEFGRIAHLTETVATEKTPLQRELSGLGRQLGIVALSVSAMVAVTGWLLGRPAMEMFMTGVSLAVAIVPEGLPAVVTVTLALGIRAMARRCALLRRLSAAETLGAATVICTDKTGTLTQNEMTVQRVWLDAGEVSTTGVGYDPAGHFEANGERLDPAGRGDLIALLETGVSCNDARLEREGDAWSIRGTPTKGSLWVAAAKAWLDLGRRAATMVVFPFSSERRRMTVVQVGTGGLVAHCKGAPEVLLASCTRIRSGDDVEPLDDAAREHVTAATEALAESGLRTLALARRELPPGIALEPTAVERDLELLGVVGILDPPRPEVPAAVRYATDAGIRVVMITGDLPATALAIARRIGLPGERALTGSDLALMDDAALDHALEHRVLFARTAPEEKLRAVARLQAQGERVAMTGDGVNDAPALKKADIGIAMGIRGTDVAKGAADMVLTDDNFASIIGAGRGGSTPVRQHSEVRREPALFESGRDVRDLRRNPARLAPHPGAGADPLGQPRDRRADRARPRGRAGRTRRDGTTSTQPEDADRRPELRAHAHRDGDLRRGGRPVAVPGRDRRLCSPRPGDGPDRGADGADRARDRERTELPGATHASGACRAPLEPVAPRRDGRKPGPPRSRGLRACPPGVPPHGASRLDRLAVRRCPRGAAPRGE